MLSNLTIKDFNKKFFLLLIFSLPFEIALDNQDNLIAYSPTNVLLILISLITALQGIYKYYKEVVYLFYDDFDYTH